MKKITLILASLMMALALFAEGNNFKGDLYLAPNNNWKKDNARFAAYFINGNSNIWADMIKVEKEEVYKVTVPEGEWTTVIFCRMKPDQLENNWDNKFNQTADLVPDGNNNLYTVKEGTWDKGGGVWSVYGEAPVAPDYFKAGDLYLAPNNNWLKDNARFAAYFVNGNKNIWADMDSIANKKVYKVTVPEGDWATVIFCRMKPDQLENNWDNKMNQTADLVPAGDNNLYTVQEGTWDKGDGIWSVYGQPIPTFTNTLYFAPNGKWNEKGARFAVNFYSVKGGDYWSSFIVKFDSVYEVAIPEGEWTNAIICRMDPDKKENKWENKWNQTGNLTPVGDNNLYTMDADSWDHGTWSKFTPKEHTFTVVGTVPCLGQNHWDANNTANDMIDEDGDGIYSRTYTDVELVKHDTITYLYKVYVDRSDKKAYGYNGQNAEVVFDKTGTYTLTFTFDTNKLEVNCKAEEQTTPTALQTPSVLEVYVDGRMVVSQDPVRIYTVTGQDVTSANGRLQNGVYIVRTDKTAGKVIIR